MNRPAIDTGFIRRAPHELRGASSEQRRDFQHAWNEASAMFTPSLGDVQAELLTWVSKTVKAIHDETGVTFGTERMQFMALCPRRAKYIGRPMRSGEADLLHAASREFFLATIAKRDVGRSE